MTTQESKDEQTLQCVACNQEAPAVIDSVCRFCGDGDFCEDHITEHEDNCTENPDADQ